MVEYMSFSTMLIISAFTFPLCMRIKCKCVWSVCKCFCSHLVSVYYGIRSLRVFMSAPLPVSVSPTAVWRWVWGGLRVSGRNILQHAYTHLCASVKVQWTALLYFIVLSLELDRYSDYELILLWVWNNMSNNDRNFLFNELSLYSC